MKKTNSRQYQGSFWLLSWLWENNTIEKMEPTTFVIAAYKNKQLVGILGWKSQCGHKTLRPFSISAGGFATWKTELGATRALEKNRAYNVNHTYTIRDWLEQEEYILKIGEINSILASINPPN